MKFIIYLTICLATCVLFSVAGFSAETISIRETPAKTPIVDMAKNKNIAINGTVTDDKTDIVFIRVTSSKTGLSYISSAKVKGKKFKISFPLNFENAPDLVPAMYMIDASRDSAFKVTSKNDQQAEAAVFVKNGSKEFPDLPSGFCNDLTDKNGNTDEKSSDYKIVKPLMNLFMRSKASFDTNIGNTDFDLDNSSDMIYFKENIALFDFNNRDRDWNKPLNNRPAKTFWKSVWNTWFNSSNDNPLDGNPKNSDYKNYMPYSFANDYTDSLIMYIMRQDKRINPLDDNLLNMCREGVENLVAMQHQEDSNFALVDHRGKQEKYTKGAFRYGMFINGNYMTEGIGWFYNPAFLDYINGGVLNGRAMWGLGESVKYDPENPFNEKIYEAFSMGLQFCLNDGFYGGYTKKTLNGNVYWKDDGEHAYLVIGMCAMANVKPNMYAFTDNYGKKYNLTEASVMSLNAIKDNMKPDGSWAMYPNTDSMAVAALADGYLTFPNHPDAKKWLQTAQKSADSWLDLKIIENEYKGEIINFGLRLESDGMTYNWGRVASDWTSLNYIFYYQTGHWIHALSRLYKATGNEKYKKRCEKMIGYLLGNNPLGTRILNETGGVYNWSEDRDKDGFEEFYAQNMYPESTAFSQIGIMHFFDATK